MYPSHANPQKKYIRAATDSTEIDAIIIWAALWDRPSPVLIRANPAPARGTRKMQKRQAIIAISVNPDAGMRIILFHLEELRGIGKERRAPEFPLRSRQKRKWRARAAKRAARPKTTPETIRRAGARNSRFSFLEPPGSNNW